MSHLLALDRSLRARQRGQALQDRSITILEDEIRRLASEKEAALQVKEKEILSLKDELVALKAVAEEKQEAIDFLWDEVDWLSTELHPGGFWQWEPEFEEDEDDDDEKEEAADQEGEQKTVDEPVLPVVEEKDVSEEVKEEGMEVNSEGTEAVVVEGSKEIIAEESQELATKEDQPERKMRWRWCLLRIFCSASSYPLQYRTLMSSRTSICVRLASTGVLRVQR